MGRGVRVLDWAMAVAEHRFETQNSQSSSIGSKPRITQNKHKNIDLNPIPKWAKPRPTNLQAVAAAIAFSLQASTVAFAATIATETNLAKMDGRDESNEEWKK